VNLPRIDRPMNASQLRDRILCQLNGESRELSPEDQRRRERVLRHLQGARKRKAGS
jgi:hypothetical protein